METNYYNAGGYTYEELQEAIKAEREECASICEELYFYPEASNELDYIRDKVSSECAEIIRQRINK